MRARPFREENVYRVGKPRCEGRLAELVEAHPARVVEILAEVLTDQRIERIEQVLSRRTRELVVLLDHVADPHNAAAVVRSAEAFGLLEIHAVHPWGDLPLSRRVTQGCHKWLEVTVYDESESCVAGLKSRGYTLLAANEHATKSPADFADAGPVVLCMGNEHKGLSEVAREACDGFVRIPMLGFTDSLNVSVATALLLRELHVGRDRPIEEDERERLRARYYALSVRAAGAILRRHGLV